MEDPLEWAEPWIEYLEPLAGDSGWSVRELVFMDVIDPEEAPQLHTMTCAVQAAFLLLKQLYDAGLLREPDNAR